MIRFFGAIFLSFATQNFVLKEIIISITQTLLTKNIAFCIYRFPHEDHFCLAIEPRYLPHLPEKSFWIAPFTHQSKADNIFLAVVKNEFLNETFLKQLETFPLEEKCFVSLPPATSKDEYFNRLDGLLKDIHSGAIKKAILSRVLYVEKPIDFKPLDCFIELSEGYPETFVHLSFHTKSGIWMGATPEMLLKKRQAEFSIMALAGTQARRNDKNYYWRDKEMEEHKMVGDHIEQVFKNFACTLLSKTGPHTFESARVAHLNTNYVFKENTIIPLKEFLTVLHPTPAVGGLPVAKGVESILKHEGYDRRYYCGFIGETDFSDSSDLYINLRCMQIGKQQIAIYVGGGITSNSVPEEEWEETVLKSKTMAEKINPFKKLY